MSRSTGCGSAYAPPSTFVSGRAVHSRRVSGASIYSRAWRTTGGAWKPRTPQPCSWPHGFGAPRSRFDQLAAKLSQLSPLRILERGYAIVSNPSGIVTNAASAPAGSGIHVKLAKGELDARVE